ncbi:MAG: hypothetical protein RL199_189 [Pseudomonadota bacterium]|jgi:hypothetical protein
MPDHARRPESHAFLAAEAQGRFGRLPSALVADVVLRVTEVGDHHLERAALAALGRRWAAAKASEGWRVTGRPSKGRVCGSYTVRTSKGASRHVAVLDPSSLTGSCDCPDYAKASLGLCKHLFFLLEPMFDKKGGTRAEALPVPPLWWHPVRALDGAGDWLEGVTWNDGPVPAGLKRHFPGAKGPVRLKAVDGLDDCKRLELVLALREAFDAQPRAALLDVALEELLDREQMALEARDAHALTGRALDASLKGLKRPLFPYQREGVAKFAARGRLLLADDMGLGKTAQAIASCHALFTAKRVTRGLIVAPASLKAQWLREWRAFSDVPVTVVEGPPAARAALYKDKSPGFLVANYEQVVNDLALIRAMAPGVVVLDEAQKIKNWASKTAASVKRLDPPWRLVLTGTPLENRLDELASLMDWVDERALEPKWRLSEWHAVRADGGHEVVGARNLATLRTRLSGPTLRRVRREVIAQLPPRTDIRIPVELTPRQVEAHAEFDHPIRVLMSQAAQRPLTQPEFLRLMTMMARQRIICNGLAQRDFAEVWPELERGAKPTESRLASLFAPKLVELRELVRRLVVEEGRKVVVFSQWKRMLHLARWATADLLEPAGLRSVSFSGDESLQRRARNVVEFHEDPSVRLFLATDAGGVGLNLQRAASALVHLDLPWNPAVLEQRNGRVHRLGQTEPVELYALVSASGIEARIEGIVGDKKALFDGLFDGTSDAVAFEKGGSFLSTLQQLVPAEPKTEPSKAEQGPVEAGEDDLDAVERPSPEAGSETLDSAPVETPASAPESLSTAAPMMPGIDVRRTADGRLVLEAQPEAAATFAAMLESVAALMRQMSAPPPAK